MLQLTPQSRIFVATQPVDFRKGIDGLAAVCRHALGDNPLEGAVSVFRNRAGTALTLLLYDGQGYGMMMKRLAPGRFRWWPTTPDVRVPWAARALVIVRWNGAPAVAKPLSIADRRYDPVAEAPPPENNRTPLTFRSTAA